MNPLPSISAVEAARRRASATLDVVIPLYNEEAMIPLLTDTLSAVFSPDALAAHGIASVRFLMVDDGSADGTAEQIANKIRDGFPAVLIRFSRNFGHQAAISAGLDRARADMTAIMDGDLQDPPDLILAMADRWRDGFDVVYAQRRTRRGNPVKKLAYRLFYRLLAFLSDIHVPLDSGDFGLMDRRVTDALRQLPEHLRFVRGLRAWVGFHQTPLPYDRPERAAGVPSYTWRRLYNLATDGVASMSIRPLQIAQFFSLVYLVVTAFFLTLLIIHQVMAGAARLRPDILLLAILIVSGNFVQSLCIHILGAYTGRGYLELKGRPTYVVMETIGDDAPPVRDPSR